MSKNRHPEILLLYFFSPEKLALLSLRDHTKSDPLVLQVEGWAYGLWPCSIKTLTDTETRSVDNETALTGGVAAGAAMTLLGQSQPETQKSIGPIVAPKRQTIIGCWNVRTMAEKTRLQHVRLSKSNTLQSACDQKGNKKVWEHNYNVPLETVSPTGISLWPYAVKIALEAEAKAFFIDARQPEVQGPQFRLTCGWLSSL